jgi:hypothetical protein
MTKCPRGHDNPDHYRHCGECGTPLVTDSGPPAGPGGGAASKPNADAREASFQATPVGLPQMHWPDPGTPPASNSPTRGQVNGGNQYSQQQPPPQSPGGVYYPQPPRGRSTSGLWWFLAVACAVAAVITLAVVIHGVSTGPAPTQPQSTSAQASSPFDPDCPSVFDRAGKRFYAPVRPEASPDCYFLYIMSAKDFSFIARLPADQRGWVNLISYAHTVCQQMENDGGADPVLDIGRQIQGDYSGMSLLEAGKFTNLAAAAYCPSVIRR